jgi:hypothetical protein
MESSHARRARYVHTQERDGADRTFAASPSAMILWRVVKLPGRLSKSPHMLIRAWVLLFRALDTGKTQLGQVHPRTTPTRQRAVGGN